MGVFCFEKEVLANARGAGAAALWQLGRTNSRDSHRAFHLYIILVFAHVASHVINERLTVT